MGRKKEEPGSLTAGTYMAQGQAPEQIEERMRKNKSLDALIPVMRTKEYPHSFVTRPGWMSAFIKYVFSSDTDTWEGCPWAEPSKAFWRGFNRKRFGRAVGHVQVTTREWNCPYLRVYGLKSGGETEGKIVADGHAFQILTTCFDKLRKQDPDVSPFWAALLFFELILFRNNLPMTIQSLAPESTYHEYPALALNMLFEHIYEQHFQYFSWQRDSMEHLLVIPFAGEGLQNRGAPHLKSVTCYEFPHTKVLGIKGLTTSGGLTVPLLTAIGGWFVPYLQEIYGVDMLTDLETVEVTLTDKILNNLQLDPPRLNRGPTTYRVPAAPFICICPDVADLGYRAAVAYASQFIEDDENIMCANGAAWVNFISKSFAEDSPYEDYHKFFDSTDPLIIYNTHLIPGKYAEQVNNLLDLRRRNYRPTVVCDYAYVMSNRFVALQSVIKYAPILEYNELLP